VNGNLGRDAHVFPGISFPSIRIRTNGGRVTKETRFNRGLAIGSRKSASSTCTGDTQTIPGRIPAEGVDVAHRALAATGDRGSHIGGKHIAFRIPAGIDFQTDFETLQTRGMFAVEQLRFTSLFLAKCL
jgi:hypothetical protein